LLKTFHLHNVLRNNGVIMAAACPDTPHANATGFSFRKAECTFTQKHPMHWRLTNAFAARRFFVALLLFAV
jgi:hypothetical protein